MSETNLDKSIFISYRRDVSSFIARAIFMDLRANGYDVFMDVESIDSGAFDTVILNQIAARTHFVLVLTPGSIDRCAEPDDWLRREIETAIDLKRNIVPLLVNNFIFKGSENQLTGKLAGLSRYNAINVPHDFFDAAMERLRTRFLKQLTEGEIVPTPVNQQAMVQQKIEVAINKPIPTSGELNAEKYFESGQKKNKRGDPDGAIADFTEAIRLNPQYSQAYNNRGNLFLFKQQLDAALNDFNTVIELDEKFANAYLNRGVVHQRKKNYQEALADYDNAILLNPGMAYAYNNRGELYFALGQYQQALDDFRKTNELKFGDRFALAGLAITRHALGEVDKAGKLWKSLLAVQGTNFNDLEWVKDELNWAEPLVDEARKLIASLDQTE